jgi:hypothetical protein
MCVYVCNVLCVFDGGVTSRTHAGRTEIQQVTKEKTSLLRPKHEQNLVFMSYLKDVVADGKVWAHLP